jgi:hypothetical protein
VKGRFHSEDVVIEERIILKWILKKTIMGCGLRDRNRRGGIEHSGSREMGNFLIN